MSNTFTFKEFPQDTLVLWEIVDGDSHHFQFGPRSLKRRNIKSF
jgi:hypothetical protein